MKVRKTDQEGFDWEYVRKLKEEPIGKGRSRKGRHYAKAVAAFDIETTNDRASKQAFMYVWMFQIDKRPTVVGRTWDEFRTFFERLNRELEHTLVCLIHNAQFEFEFLKSVIPIDDAFALDERKILYFRSGKVEFRCSYLHSNMSLKKYLERMKVPTQKGEMDYSIPRYPWTKLTHDEWAYCIADVKGLVEAYTKEMKLDGDNLYTVPLTSTGYVRRSARLALQAYQRYIKPQLPDLDTLHMLMTAFRGGNTHGSVYWTGRVVENVTSYDLASSYPSVLMEEEFPTAFEDADPAMLKYFLDRLADAAPAPYEQHILLVHNVCLGQEDIDAAGKVMKNVYWAICPLSNIFIHNALPPISLMRKNGLAIALGTDSLSSNDDLDMVKEMYCLHSNFPEVPMTEILTWASLNGARFLSKDSVLGTLAPGKRPGLVRISDIDENGFVTADSRSKRII